MWALGWGKVAVFYSERKPTLRACFWHGHSDIYCMTSEHVSISPPSVLCQQCQHSPSMVKAYTVAHWQHHSMHSPPIYASLLFSLFTLFSWLIGFLFPGEDGVTEFDRVCVMLLTQPAATRWLWNTAPLHCPSSNPHPPPPPPYFWTPSIIRWLPHSICASYLPLTVWKSWKGLTS